MKFGNANASHYNNVVTSLGKQGVNFVLKNKLITTANVLAQSVSMTLLHMAELI